jgi:hypothetical protein
MPRLSVFRVTFVAAALLVAAGCKSGLNERCQLDDDCAAGLVCSPGAMICVDTVLDNGDGGVDGALDANLTDADLTDAPVVVDAPDIDAPDIDAPIDSPP